MEKYEVQFLQEALDDLEEIVVYVAQNSRDAALRVHGEIMEKTGALSVFPRRGRLVPDAKMSASGYRMLIVTPYIAFYRIIDRNVFIYRVIHGAVNYPLLYDKMSQSVNDTNDPNPAVCLY